MPTEAQRRQRDAHKQLNIKLKLERRLHKRMRRFFAKQNRKFLRIKEDFDRTYDAREDSEELNEILEKHYDDALKAFVPFIILEVDRALKEEDIRTLSRMEKVAIISAVTTFVAKEVPRSVLAISKTTNKYIVQALEDNIGDNTGAYKQLQSKNMVRADTIAVTETQKAAEGTKQIASSTSEEIVAAGGLGAVMLRTIKEWITRLDLRVRSAHQLAHGQIRQLEEPYLVDGEQLMYPGDMSLGASIGNVVNCRCNSVQSFTITK